MLGSLRCFRAPATVRCFRAPVTERYFRGPGCHLRYFRAPATSVQHCESQHTVREHTVRAASIVFHMFMHLFLIVHEIRKSFVHSIWPKSYTDYRVLFNPSSHASESLAMQEVVAAVLLWHSCRWESNTNTRLEVGPCQFAHADLPLAVCQHQQQL